ncbi:hypothetical protein J6590_069267 [Homalodisca vitripennis]|nr:hypothetical protein J6590_069267 [Homalodisca vitripennis]
MTAVNDDDLKPDVRGTLINGLVDCPDLLVLIDLGVPRSFQSEIPPYILFIQLWSGKASEARWQDVWKY